MKAVELLSALEEGRIPAVTVFFGEEGWFAKEGIRLVRASFLEDDGEGYVSYRAPRELNDREGTPLLEAIEDGRTVPMFGGRKVIAWRGTGLEKEDVAALAELAAASPRFLRMVVVLTSLTASASKKLSAAGALVGDCRRLFDTPWPGNPEYQTPLNQWTVGRASLRRLRLPLRVAHVLTGALGNDLSAIEAALEKLMLADGPGREIYEEDLGPVIGGGRDFNAFAFGEALYAGDAAKAFRIARSSFRDGVADRKGQRSRGADDVSKALLWSAGYQHEKVVEAARMFAEGRSADEVAVALGKGRKNPAAVRSARYAGNFRPEELNEHQLLLTAAEAETRTAVPNEVVIELLIARLTGAADD